ncbi:MAG: YkgJ family cysteine cluster protein [Elusimicrobia bacterium]|nr:YkgJ family cysteine cluster protein [Elusimicrobiota bacterium]
MDCRPGCAACCQAPSISSPLPGMPGGKPAGTACVNLTEAGLCSVWGTDLYPPVCRDFPAESGVCGGGRQEALVLLASLEDLTRP